MSKKTKTVIITTDKNGVHLVFDGMEEHEALGLIETSRQMIFKSIHKGSKSVS